MAKSNIYTAKTSINTSTINTSSLPSNLPPALQHLKESYTKPSTTSPSVTSSYTGPLPPALEQSGIFNTAYAAEDDGLGSGFRDIEKIPGTLDSVTSKTVFTTPGGNKTKYDLNKNPKLGTMIDTMEQQKAGNYGFNVKSGVGNNIVAGAPKTGSWYQVKSSSGTPMYINKNDKLNASGLQNVIDNQSADRQFNQFLKTTWRTDWLTNPEYKNSGGLKTSNFDSVFDSWNISDSKKSEFKKDMAKRITNLNKAYGFSTDPTQRPRPVNDPFAGMGLSTSEKKAKIASDAANMFGNFAKPNFKNQKLRDLIDPTSSY